MSPAAPSSPTINHAIDHAFVPQARDISRHFKTHGFALHAVGGAVRDALAGRAVGDIDFTTDALPDQVTRICKAARCAVIPTGIKHGTVTALWKGASFEITTYRTDIGYSDSRHPDAVAFTASLEEDLARRDFTVNAIAFDVLTGEIIDPFGGRADIARGIIRCVGDPDTRFREDALRMLRCVRFAVTLGYEIDPRAFEAVQKGAQAVTLLSKERVAEELKKMLLSSNPLRAYDLLRESALYEHIFPRIPKPARLQPDDDATRRLLARLSDVSLGASVGQEHGARTAGEMSADAVLQDAEQRLALRYAAICFDGSPENILESVGVSITPTAQTALQDLIQRAKQTCMDLRVSNKTLSAVRAMLAGLAIPLYKRSKYADNHSGGPRPARYSQKRMRMAIAILGLEKTRACAAFQLLLLQAQPSPSPEARAALVRCIDFLNTEGKAAAQSPADVHADGQKIAGGETQGRWIGDIKKTLLRYICAHPENNTEDVLLPYAQALREAQK